MNAGKTTTAVGLIKGLRAAGLDVGAAKVTGTGAGGDVWSMLDAGAFPVVDFTDAGFPSTYRLPITQVEQVLTTLVEYVSVSAVAAIVLKWPMGCTRAKPPGC
jgi:molybdopterin-guanine dinucleotide biosynthesis protein